MPAIFHVCRRARREDIPKSMGLWGRDEPLYDAEVWNRLPALLVDLMERDFVTYCIVESVPNRVPRMFGAIAFVRPEYIDEARAGRSTLPNLAMRAALRNRRPFLSPKEVAIENARGTLNLINFLGNFDIIDLADAELANFYDTSNDGYRFFRVGYSCQAQWFEVWEAHHVEELQKQGMRIDRQLSLPYGRTSTLLRLTKDDALANPFARFCGFFFPEMPRFPFSFGEQRLLEYALLEWSDEEVQCELHLTKDAVKKRWRSIYRKVELANPEVVRGSDSGAGRRRMLLRYLRANLAEIRPYLHGKAASH